MSINVSIDRRTDYVKLFGLFGRHGRMRAKTSATLMDLNLYLPRLTRDDLETEVN